MATFIEVYRTTISGGIAQADSELIIIALYGSAETIDTNDGADLRIIDSDDDGSIGRAEFADATGGGGLGQNGGGATILFDGDGNNNTGTLYSSDPFVANADLNTTINSLDANFLPVAPDTLAADTMVPCFGPGTLIRTPTGDRPIEIIRPGDLVCTLDRGPQEVLWVKHRTAFLQPECDNDRPVFIARGAFGPGLPRRDLILSPQHRVLVTHEAAVKRFGSGGVFILAKAFTNQPRIRTMRGRQYAEYCTILLRQHAVIYAEGLQVESFYPGAYALRAFNKDTRDDLYRLFPNILRKGYGPHARPVLTLREGREFLALNRCAVSKKVRTCAR